MEMVGILTAFLTPFLPSLLRFGQPISEEAGKALGNKLGEGTWEKAKELWKRLYPSVESKPLAMVAAQELAKNEDNTDARDLFVAQLKKLLQENSVLSREIEELLQEKTEVVSKIVKINQNVTGNKNIVIGQSDGKINIQQR